MLQYVPDHFLLSVTGTSFGILMETEEETVLMDDIVYLEGLLCEQKEKADTIADT